MRNKRARSRKPYQSLWTQFIEVAMCSRDDHRSVRSFVISRMYHLSYTWLQSQLAPITVQLLGQIVIIFRGKVKIPIFNGAFEFQALKRHELRHAVSVFLKYTFECYHQSLSVCIRSARFHHALVKLLLTAKFIWFTQLKIKNIAPGKLKDLFLYPINTTDKDERKFNSASCACFLKFDLSLLNKKKKKKGMRRGIRDLV